MNLFTTRELSEVLESLDVNNSSGEDTIENTIIKKLPKKIPTVLMKKEEAFTPHTEIDTFIKLF